MALGLATGVARILHLDGSTAGAGFVIAADGLVVSTFSRERQ